MQVGHFESLALLYPSGVIGHHAAAQVLSPWMETLLYSNIFGKKNGRAEAWCRSKLLPVTLTR